MGYTLVTTCFGFEKRQKPERKSKPNKVCSSGFYVVFFAFLVFVRLGCLVKAFRKKLTKRPLALRCQTQYIQAHDFGDVVMRYLDCPKDSFAWKLQQLLTDGSVAIDPAVGQFWHELIGDSPPCLSKEIQRAAFAILWMGLRGEREGLPSMLATSFAEAAGVAGRQKWGLVLSAVHGSPRLHIKRLLE